MEDAALLKRYLEGDHASFELLLKKHAHSLYGFIFTFVKDKDTAEDILQDTFIKSWKNIKRFDTKKSFRTWIFTIAKNSSLDFLKKKKTLPFSSFQNDEGESMLEEIPDEQELMQATLEIQDDTKRLDTLLLSLPEKYQQVLRLFYQEEFSLTEISEILEQPYNTVKSWHFRGIQLLRKELSAP